MPNQPASPSETPLDLKLKNIDTFRSFKKRGPQSSDALGVADDTPERAEAALNEALDVLDKLFEQSEDQGLKEAAKQVEQAKKNLDKAKRASLKALRPEFTKPVSSSFLDSESGSESKNEQKPVNTHKINGFPFKKKMSLEEADEAVELAYDKLEQAFDHLDKVALELDDPAFQEALKQVELAENRLTEAFDVSEKVFETLGPSTSSTDRSSQPFSPFKYPPLSILKDMMLGPPPRSDYMSEDQIRERKGAPLSDKYPSDNTAKRAPIFKQPSLSSFSQSTLYTAEQIKALPVLDHLIYLLAHKESTENILQKLGEFKEPAATNAQGASLLHAVVHYARPELIDAVLASGVPIDTQDAQGYSALHLAAGNNQSDIVEKLLSAKANVNTYTAEGITPLLSSLRLHSNGVLERLLAADANQSATATTPHSALELAIASEESPYVPGRIELLIQHGGDVHQKAVGGKGLLHLATVFKAKYIGALLKAGADINVQDDHGLTPLMLAILESKESLALGLIDSKANLQLATSDGQETALMLAAESFQSHIVESILKADPKTSLQQNSFGNTAFHHFIESSESLSPQAFAHHERAFGRTSKLFLKHAPEALQITNHRQQTPLHKMVRLVGLSMRFRDPVADDLRQMIRAGADPYRRDEAGETAIDYLAGGWFSDVAIDLESTYKAHQAKAKMGEFFNALNPAKLISRLTSKRDEPSSLTNQAQELDPAAATDSSLSTASVPENSSPTSSKPSSKL